MVKKHLGLYLIILVLVSGCATIGSSRTDLQPGMKVKGYVYSGGATNISVPLLEGEWEVASSEAWVGYGSAQYQVAALVKTENNVVNNVIFILYPLDESIWGYGRNNNCSRNDVHFVKTKSNKEFGDQDCMWVNHFHMLPYKNMASYKKKLLKYISDKKYKIPIAMLSVGYRFASSNKYLTLEYFFNPRTEGFPETKNRGWSSSDWSKKNVLKDGKKKKYVESKIIWAKKWRQKVKAGFYGKRIELNGRPQ